MIQRKEDWDAIVNGIVLGFILRKQRNGEELDPEQKSWLEEYKAERNSFYQAQVLTRQAG